MDMQVFHKIHEFTSEPSRLYRFCLKILSKTLRKFLNFGKNKKINVFDN